jgi:ribosome biogenesis ATPase
MGVPDEAAREKILEKLSQKLRLQGDFDFSRLAKLTPGYVGADLKALTSEAGMIAVQRIFETLGQEDSNDMDVSMDIISKTDSLYVQAMIHKFIESRMHPLTSQELEPLCITHLDFEKALKKVQPSAKREGFATVPGVSWEDIGALEVHFLIINTKACTGRVENGCSGAYQASRIFYIGWYHCSYGRIALWPSWMWENIIGQSCS